ncbi:FkbM family methyltransferase [Planctomycetota bacterium]
MYAQNDEEAVIDLLFPNVKDGAYVDIGAGGIPESNTYKYYQMGWHGLLVEPRPDIVDGLRTLRPRDTIVQAAACDADGEVTMHADGNLTRLSPMEADEPGMFRCRGLTMATLLEEFPQFRAVHFASIDVEGAEERVLSSVDLEAFTPDLLIVEYNTAGVSTDTRDAWEPYLLPFYEPVYCNGVNGFYVRRAIAHLRSLSDG